MELREGTKKRWAGVGERAQQLKGFTAFVDNLGFSSLQLHDGSQLSITPVLGYLIPTSGLWYTGMHGNKTPIQRNVNLTERDGNHSDMNIRGCQKLGFPTHTELSKNTRLGCLGCKGQAFVSSAWQFVPLVLGDPSGFCKYCAHTYIQAEYWHTSKKMKKCINQKVRDGIGQRFSFFFILSLSFFFWLFEIGFLCVAALELDLELAL